MSLIAVDEMNKGSQIGEQLSDAERLGSRRRPE
jgi:hypothetical protein